MRCPEKPMVYNTRPQGCQHADGCFHALTQFPQLIDFRAVSTYTAPMVRRYTGLAVLLLTGLTSIFISRPHAQAQPEAGLSSQGPAFRAGVDLVSLNVTVTDPTSGK